jgi:hypothetical protein
VSRQAADWQAGVVVLAGRQPKLALEACATVEASRCRPAAVLSEGVRAPVMRPQASQVLRNVVAALPSLNSKQRQGLKVSSRGGRQGQTRCLCLAAS